MTLVPKDFWSRCRAFLQGLPGRQFEALFTWEDGAIQAAAAASGQRDYCCGDDYRYVNWRHCAEHDELLTRLFYGNERRRLRLLLDDGARMRLGSPAKFDVARQLAAALAWLGWRRHMRPQAAVFSGLAQSSFKTDACWPARDGLLEFFSSLQTQPGAVDLAATSRVCAAWPASHVILISDLFLGSGLATLVQLLQRWGHRPVVIHLFDRQDQVPDMWDRVRLVDVELGRGMLAEIDEVDAAEYSRQFAGFLRAWQGLAARQRFMLAQVEAGRGWEECLRQVLRTTWAASSQTTWRHHQARGLR